MQHKCYIFGLPFPVLFGLSSLLIIANQIKIQFNNYWDLDMVLKTSSLMCRCVDDFHFFNSLSHGLQPPLKV